MTKGKEKLSVKCDQLPILTFEGFVVKPFDGWNLFIENPAGEGTTIRKSEFLNVLVNLFDRNF